MRVLIIGAGKMVDAILAGLSPEDLSHWGICSKTGASARALAASYGLNFVNDPTAFEDPDWILLACKPQQLKEVSVPDVPVMSVLAALPEKDQKEILGVTHLVRIMPNLPVRLKKGVSLISTSSLSLVDFPRALFGKLGLVKVLPENELEELTLLTGSGPALFYEFARDLSASFSSLTEDERQELARATLLGSALSCGDREFQTLIDAVTSKGGVSIAVLEEWRKRDLAGVLKSGVRKGLQRAQEIRAHLLRS